MKVSNQNKFDRFRKEYPFFEFQSYSFQVKNKNLEVKFSFNLSKKFFFTPRITFKGSSVINFKQADKKALDSLVFHIGMVELISYWKAACPPKVIIRPYGLTDEQVSWWKKLYFHGLGEFFYLNGIQANMDDFMEFETAFVNDFGTSSGTLEAGVEPLSGALKAFEPDRNKVIVPVGGGKDSVVTLELLKDSDKEVIPLVVNPRPASIRTIEAAGYSLQNSIVIERKLDPVLLELNDRGFLNGHTPFSALLAFIGATAQVASGAGNIALSNESSASESTVPGTKINHQYSKSIEFEEDFISYTRKYLSPGISYFSFLRPLNELQIARLFSSFPWHFTGFRSCNVGSKNDTWCGKCPKCLFTYIILSPFIAPNRLEQIFGKNLLEDESLSGILDELTGKATVKPFECIGTPDEARNALWYLAKKTDEKKQPLLLKQFLRDFPLPDINAGFESLLNNYNTHHFPEPEFENLLKSALSDDALGFKKFLKNILKENEKVLILGFGREGRSTYRLIRELFPRKMLGISDRDEEIAGDELIRDDGNLKLHLGGNHQNASEEYDLVFKSPGVKLENKEGIEQNGVSQTAVFLGYYRDRTIGVTGTKGKSTTASLIHHLLKESGHKSVLLGNIGKPAFDAVGETDFDTIVVFELSANQLEDVYVSPHVAVLLNVFPEHLDHFASFAEYRKAKHNIYKYQIPGDVLITAEDEHIGDTAGSKKTFGKAVTADGKLIEGGLQFQNGIFPLDELELQLKGEHNMLNMLAAMLAVREYGVSFEQAVAAVKKFRGLPHRLEYIGRYGDIRFYNDSISTIPQSTMAAVKSIPDVDTLILGGFDRGLDYSELVGFLKKSKIRNFIFLGKAGNEMYKLFGGIIRKNRRLFRCKNLEEAFEIIKKHTEKGKVCLLSPAAASYDQFHNFEHRGDAFSELAKKI